MQGGLAPLLVFLLLHFVTGLFMPPFIPAAPPLFALVRTAGAWLDRRLNRDSRAKRVLALRGAFVTLAFLAAAALLGRAVLHAEPRFVWMAALVLLFGTTALMQPLTVLRAVAKALKDKNTAQAAALLQPYVTAPLGAADAFTVARKAVEWSASALNAWFTGPLFWFVMAGPRGCAVYAIIAALRVTIAADDTQHAYFGLAARWIDDALNFFSGAVTVAGLAFSAIFVSRANPLRALKTVIARGRNYPRGTGEWPVAAMAGALGVTLTGPPYDWIGPEGSSAKVLPDDVERCALLHFVFFLCAMSAASAAILSTKFLHIF